MLLQAGYYCKFDLSFFDFRKMFLPPWMRVQEVSGFAFVCWTCCSAAALDYLIVCHDPCELIYLFFQEIRVSATEIAYGIY